MSGPASKSGAERRKALRLSRGPMEVKILGTRTASGRVVDISTSGMLIEVDHSPPKVGSEVQLKLQLPGEKVRLQPTVAVVRHASPRQFAVRFLRISNDELSGLQRFIEREGHSSQDP
jgi:hypothetical protein